MNVKLSQYIKELQEKLDKYGDASVILEERGREPYIQNISYGGKIHSYMIY